MHTFRDLSTRKRNLVQSSHLIFPQKAVPFLSLIWFRFSDDHARRRCSDDCKGLLQLPYYPMLSVFEINGSFISFDCAPCAAGPQREPDQGPVSTKSEAHGGPPDVRAKWRARKRCSGEARAPVCGLEPWLLTGVCLLPEPTSEAGRQWNKVDS